MKGRKENEIRLARLCWNENGWVKPSGRKGKSKTRTTYECENGFGHEEWLFDREKVIDGYHYGFIQSVGSNYEKYIDQEFRIFFYSINSETKDYYWVGEIPNVEVISSEQATKIYNKYKKEGWFDQMVEDLKIYDNLKVKEFLHEKNPWQYFNIRFKAKAISDIYAKPRVIDNPTNIIRSTRYKLINFDASLLKGLINEDETGYDFESGSLDSHGLKKKSTKIQTTKSIELPLNHNKMMRGFLKFLQETYPFDQSRRECRAYGNNHIDIVRRTKDGDIFYEIKTYNHLIISIRVALGQLMEYAFFPNVKNAMKMSIVSDLPPDDKIRKYIVQINKILKIPLSYIYYDCAKNEIIEEIPS